MKKYLVILIAFLLTGCPSQNENNPSAPTADATVSPTATTTAVQSAQPTVIPTAQPEATPEPVQEPVYVPLGEYQSPLTSNDKNRLYNIKLSAEKLDMHIIAAGETFSFNETVGDTGKAQGYKKAVIYVDGHKEKGYGGGVCQLSSTMYNAALNSGLKIVERHPHNGPEVKYVPKDMDATVAYGLKDLKIKNICDMPIRVRTGVDGSGVSVLLEIQKK